MEILDELLGTEPYLSSFENYQFVPRNLWNIIPLGSYIKYCNRNYEIINGGFLVDMINHSCVERRVYVIKYGKKTFDFHPFFYYVFYKNINEKEEIIHIKPTVERSNKKKRKPIKNIDLFSKLLDAL
jgi:hypothetical protein